MAVKAPKGKCCSGRAAKLKKVNFDKATKAAKSASSGGAKPATAKKAPAKKAPKAKKAPGCRVCGK